MKKKILLFIIILLLAFIWGQSFLPKDASARESGFFYQIIKPFLELFVGPGNLTRNMVRKIAHYAEFALLGLTLSFLFKNKHRGFLWTCGTAFLAAFLDETIQIFSGRGPMIADVWLDLAGTVTTAGIFFLIRYLRNRKGSKTADPAS